MASITNAVLNERQEQQHTQTMVALARIDDRLVKMNGSVRLMQINDAGHEQRIVSAESRLVDIEQKQEEAQTRSWRLAVAIALLTGAGMAGVNTVLGLIMP